MSYSTKVFKFKIRKMVIDFGKPRLKSSETWNNKGNTHCGQFYNKTSSNGMVSS